MSLLSRRKEQRLHRAFLTMTSLVVYACTVHIEDSSTTSQLLLQLHKAACCRRYEPKHEPIYCGAILDLPYKVYVEEGPAVVNSGVVYVEETNIYGTSNQHLKAYVKEGLTSSSHQKVYVEEGPAVANSGVVYVEEIDIYGII
jgi:hypothetical protein